MSAFTASCPFEIGDKVRDTNGHILTITDIASVHYLKKQTVEFFYEFDNSGKYQRIEQLPSGGGLENNVHPDVRGLYGNDAPVSRQIL
jgi:hypothetical protein